MSDKIWVLEKILVPIQGVEKVDTLSSKAHFIQAFDEQTEV